MPLDKIDNRLCVLIEYGVKLGHRTLFVILGTKGKDQVMILHHLLAKTKEQPSVLWCYKKDPGFNIHRKKRMKHIQQQLQASKLSLTDGNPFDLFLTSTKIRFCYYSDSQKILGNTYGMCVLQDFEALTPNLLARTIETVEGGGLVVILLQSVTSLEQLYNMTMDVHQKLRTEAHQKVVCHFNERLVLSLPSCKRCLVLDDQLTVLPMFSQNLDVEPEEITPELSVNETELVDLKKKFANTGPIDSLINCCRTLDQTKALRKFAEVIGEKSLEATISLTAARGRGKSAALGLAVSAAIASGYSNVFVTSPSPENLNTFFEFVFKGFDAIEYEEYVDYSLVQSSDPELNKAVVRVNIFRDRRQVIQYIYPSEAHKLSQAELLIIDEAAAIPLPYVKALLGPYLVFLASTINGYEGTGRSLSLKLLQELRQQVVSQVGKTNKRGPGVAVRRKLYEITLEEPIRYKSGDDVENWLTKLLCLDATSVAPILSTYPSVDNCDLYYINRETLFSYHKASEEFLQRLVALYVASHYKNTPNDLQMMADAPAHHLFCLLGPIDSGHKTLPEVLVIIQVCLEGEISKSSVVEGFSRGKRAAGDLIPWTIGQQYQDPDFPQLAGARIVRIATHPDCQGMGYGAKALTLLKQYYEFNFPVITEDIVAEENNVSGDEVGSAKELIQPRDNLPSLLLKLNERPSEKLDYLGVSFGLTEQLLRFWKRSGYIPVYLRQTTNDLTGEHSCIMLNVLSENRCGGVDWLVEYWTDFRRRFINLLSYQFNKFSPALALSVLINKCKKIAPKDVTREELESHLTDSDIKRLEMYSNNLVDYHLIIDLVPTLARLYFLSRMGDVQMSAVQCAILLGIGLQHKTVDTLATELDLPSSQLLGLFNRLIRKSVQYFEVVSNQGAEKSRSMTPVAKSLKKLNKLNSSNLRKSSTGNDEEIVVTKSNGKRSNQDNNGLNKAQRSPKKKKKQQ